MLTFLKVYNDISGFGSLKQTLSYARGIDPSNKLDDVKQWMEENTQRKKQLPCQISCVANAPHHAYKLDLVFIKHLEDQSYYTTMVCIDAFSKYAAVVPIRRKI